MLSLVFYFILFHYNRAYREKIFIVQNIKRIRMCASNFYKLVFFDLWIIRRVKIYNNDLGFIFFSTTCVKFSFV